MSLYLVAVSCLLLFPLSCMTVLHAQQVSSKFVSTHTFGDLSRIQITKDTLWVFHESAIRYDIDITVTEAYYGCVKEVSYQRLVADHSCQITNCAYCKSKGVIVTKTVSADKHLEQHLQTPCPVCLGRLKAGKDGCKYYEEKVEHVKFVVPPGARLGHQVQFKHLGNAMLDVTTPGNFTFSVGDLYLTVGKVTDPTGSGLNMTTEGLELNIIMKPIEALEGFTRKFEYFDGKVINIDKTNKTTLPGTEIVMEDANLVHVDSLRNGLLIRFSMLSVQELKAKLEEELRIEAATNDQLEATLISSQADFDAWEESKKDKRKQFKRDCIITKFLHDIKRRQDEGLLDEFDDDDEEEARDGSDKQQDFDQGRTQSPESQNSTETDG